MLDARAVRSGFVLGAGDTGRLRSVQPPVEPWKPLEPAPAPLSVQEGRSHTQRIVGQGGVEIYRRMSQVCLKTGSEVIRPVFASRSQAG